MKKLALVPISQVEGLPKWSAPKNLDAAAADISELGRNVHEHAYLVGCHLLWVKRKVGHGKFLKWLEQNVKRMGQQTANNMMRFAARCIKAGELIEYHGSRIKLPSDSNLKPGKKDHDSESPGIDPRPVESRLFFDVAHRIEETFPYLTQDQQSDFVETMKDLIKQLEKRIEENVQ